MADAISTPRSLSLPVLFLADPIVLPGMVVPIELDDSAQAAVQAARAAAPDGEPGRRPTGEVWTPEVGAAAPERDWILTRILWLSGTEPGFNRLGKVDSMRRYIYIHGTPDTEPMGVPRSISSATSRLSLRGR